MFPSSHLVGPMPSHHDATDEFHSNGLPSTLDRDRIAVERLSGRLLGARGFDAGRPRDENMFPQDREPALWPHRRRYFHKDKKRHRPWPGRDPWGRCSGRQRPAQADQAAGV